MGTPPRMEMASAMVTGKGLAGAIPCGHSSLAVADEEEVGGDGGSAAPTILASNHEISRSCRAPRIPQCDADHRNVVIQKATLPSEAAPGDQVSHQEIVRQKSEAVMKSLLAKRKLSAVNVSKPPSMKKMVLSGPHVPFVRSPILSRMLLSPPTRSSPSASPNGERISSPNIGQGTTRTKRKRKLRSSVWREFQPIYEGNIVVQAKCNYCLEIFPATRDSGRSSCRRHLLSCKERNRIDQMVKSMGTSSLSPDALALKNWKFDQEAAREAMANFIVLLELPFSLVDHEPFRNFIAILNPWFTIVSRNTVVDDIMRSYEDRKLALREIVKNSDSRVSLIADLWTSKQNLGYLCITCHFIDNDWILQKRIISFGLVASPHNGLTLFNALLKSLQEWKLEHKLFSITLDNAKNNNKMVFFLRKNFTERHLILGKGDLLHMRCGSHVFNIIAHDGLKLMDPAIARIRESVIYTRSSQAGKQRFEEIIVQLGISCEKRPTLDVPTRWNSTYLMLKYALEYRTAFDALYSQDPSFMEKPSSGDWEMADLLCNILKPFYDATNTVSGSLYPTANHYFHVSWKVKEKIEKETKNEDQSIAAMAVKMKEKFQKYWDLSLLQICIPVVLDPRFKFQFVAFRLAAGFGNKGAEYTGKVKMAMEDLFSVYSSMTTVPDINSEPRVSSEIVYEDWEQHFTAQKRSQVKNELDSYLQEELFPQQTNFDILQWWMMHCSKYPILSRMARDVLAAPAPTVASESAFSTGKRVISDYRSRLTSKNVQALICL